MISSKAELKEALQEVPTRTWKLIGGLLLFGLVMRLVTSQHN